jgi:hypothetical protein
MHFHPDFPAEMCYPATRGKVPRLPVHANQVVASLVTLPGSKVAMLVCSRLMKKSKVYCLLKVLVDQEERMPTALRTGYRRWHLMTARLVAAGLAGIDSVGPAGCGSFATDDSTVHCG